MKLATEREAEINLLKDVKLHSLDGQRREHVLANRVQVLAERLRFVFEVTPAHGFCALQLIGYMPSLLIEENTKRAKSRRA
jgi:hypothetical protein